MSGPICDRYQSFDQQNNYTDFSLKTADNLAHSYIYFALS